jgi:hypothetical protein
MTIDTFLVKRKALYRGEVGLFPNSEIAEEDLALIAMGAEVMATLRREKNIQALRYLWGLVHKVAENSELFMDKDDAMDGLKKRVGFSKAVYDPHARKIEVKAKSLTRISDERLRLLTEKIQGVICNEILPGITSTTLRREIEEMINERHTA